MSESSNKNSFGFEKPAEKENKTETPVTVQIEQQRQVEPDTREEDENVEYTDTRKVTIALVKNYSLFRRVNDKVMPKRVDYIGSSINSSRTLAANRKEVETYFPNLIGISPNNERFTTEVKKYLNNIRVAVDELGRELNISFHYYKKSDYLRFKEREEAIDAQFNNVNRNNLAALKEALSNKITLLNALESEKCSYGYPLNVEEYLIYRHCLLYKDVAKDTALINSDSSIRFYIKDNKKEEEKLQKFREQVLRAKANYVTAMGDNTLFDAIYVQYCVINNLPVLSSLAEERIQREIKLDKFSQDEPAKFNKIFNNKDVKTIAAIEMLIARGELVRSQYNQQISTSDGVSIGANMNEALSWFKNVENTQTVNAFMAKLKNI